MDLVQQLINLNFEGKYEQVIDTVQALSKEERTPHIQVELGIAYFFKAMAFKDHQVYFKNDDGSLVCDKKGKPLEGFDVFINSAENLFLENCLMFKEDIRFHQFFGMTLDVQKKYSMAFIVYHKAMMMFKDKPLTTAEEKIKKNIAERYEIMTTAITYPDPQPTMAQKVQQFWSEFVAKETDLRINLANSASQEQHELAYKLMDQCLEALGFAVKYQIDELDGIFTVHLSMDDKEYRVFALHYLVNIMPVDSLPKWRFSIGFVPDYEKVGCLEGISFNSNDLRVWVAKQQKISSNMLILGVYCEKLANYLQSPTLTHEQYEQAIKTLRDYCLSVIGELNYCTYVMDFRLLKSVEESSVLQNTEANVELIVEDMLFKDLADFKVLQMYGLEEIQDVKQHWVACTTPYNSKEYCAEVQEPDLRDIEFALTLMPDLTAEFLNDYYKLSDEMVIEGCVPFEICFLRASFDSNVPTDALLQWLHNRILGALQGTLPYQNQTIGSALGTQFVYLNVLSFDFRATMEALNKYFQQEKDPWIAVRVMRPDTRFITIKALEKPGFSSKF